MTKEPPLSHKFTATLALVTGGVVWAFVTTVAATILPGPVAITIGVVLGATVMLLLPIPLRRPDLVVLMAISVGGLVVLIGFVTQAGSLGLGLALAGAAVIGTSALSYGRIIGANDRISLAWALKRFVVPALTRPRAPKN